MKNYENFKIKNMNSYKKTFKPYLINAFFTWSIDSALTPLIEIAPGKLNKLPDSLQDKPSIIFNIHTNAVHNLVFGKDYIEFEAKVSGEPQQISIHFNSIRKIFTIEHGEGLEFQGFEELEDLSNIKPMKRKKHLFLVKNEE